MHFTSRKSGAAGITRRGFFTAALASGLAWKANQQPIWAARKRADSAYGPIQITDIEVHNLTDEFVDWISYKLTHFYGPWEKTVYVVHTDAGLIGLGESGSPEPTETVEKYIGTSPFDWVGDETSLGLGTAMYDLMGKAANVPVSFSDSATDATFRSPPGRSRPIRSAWLKRSGDSPRWATPG